jgi:diguanylate cyclase (GGDEF)-like protein/PAS domain S-box-containing protein
MRDQQRVGLADGGRRDAPVPAGRETSRRDLLLEALIRATSEIVWHHDVESGLADRRGWAEYTGVEPEAGVPFAWLTCVHPDDRAVARRVIDRAVTERTPFTVEYRLSHRSGEWRWVEDHAIPIIDGDRLTDWVGIVTDIHDRRAAERELRDSELRLRLAIEATSLGIWDVDLATGVRTWSVELKAMLGLPPDVEADEALLIGCVHPEDRDTVAAHDRSTFPAGSAAPNGALFRIIRRDDGRVRWIHSEGRSVCAPDGTPVRRIGTFQDITEQQETREALKLAMRRQEALIAATSEIVWRASADQTDGDGTGWAEFTGQSEDDARGDGWLSSVHPDDRAKAKSICEQAMSDGTPYVNEYRLWHHTGGWRWVLDRVVPLFDDDGAVTEWVGIISDNHDRKTAEEAIRFAANTDALTGLANRAMFQARLDAALAEAQAKGGAVALVLLDLDRFKEVNDSLGHDAGDEVLRTVARRLTRALPHDATIARLGGDEFGIVLPRTGRVGVGALCTGLLGDLRQPVRYLGREMDCAATIGYSTFPDDDTDAQRVLKNADMALYAAKTAGRGRAFAFTPAMRHEFDRRLQVLRNAKDALASDALVPFYQPKVSLRTGRIVGFEALLRWWDGRQLQPPAALLEAFSDAELAAAIGGRILDRVLADMARWRADGVPFGQVAVNLAAPEFLQADLSGRILERLEDRGIPVEALEVEVTEGVLMENDAEALATTLGTLHRAGVSIALDDFGTGYASLTHLKRYPVSWLKIDRSFVAGMETDHDSAAIVLAVLGMAHSIGIRVVAEGVETEGQYACLRDNGCDVAQGFLIARPMAASRVPRFIAVHEPRQAAAPTMPVSARRRAGGGPPGSYSP